MSFSEEMAKVVADPLARFVTFKSPAGAGSYKVADPDVANESSRRISPSMGSHPPRRAERL